MVNGESYGWVLLLWPVVGVIAVGVNIYSLVRKGRDVDFHVKSPLLELRLKAPGLRRGKQIEANEAESIDV